MKQAELLSLMDAIGAIIRDACAPVKRSIDQLVERMTRVEQKEQPTIEQIVEAVMKRVQLPSAQDIAAEVLRTITLPTVPSAKDVAALVVLPAVPTAEEVAKLVAVPTPEDIAKLVTVPTAADVAVTVAAEVLRSLPLDQIAAQVKVTAPPTAEEVAKLVSVPTAEDVAKLVSVPKAEDIAAEVRRSIEIPAVPTAEQVAAAMPAPATAEEVVKLVPIDEIVTRVRSELPTVEQIAKAVVLPEIPELPHVPTLEEVVDSLKEILPSLIPAPLKGDKGESITIAEVRPVIEELIKALPKPQDGKSLTVDDVRPLFAQWQIEFERRAVDRHDQLLAQFPKPKDGRDGLGFEDLSFDLSHEQKQLTLTFKREGAEPKVFSFFVPYLRHVGVFRGDAKYLEGDCVVRGGSTWMAAKSDPGGEPNDGKSMDWRLIVKRGNDGKDSKEPPPAPRVRVAPRT